MLSLSIERLPSRWRIALAARCGVKCANTASTHTPTIPQWRTPAAAYGPPRGHWTSSPTAQRQFHTKLTPEERSERRAASKARKEARKASKAARLDPETGRLPKCKPFGGFEDVIQPVALTMWGGKVQEKQSSPKLTYQAEFLGPTHFYRVKIGVRKPEREGDIWRTLWLQTRPRFVHMVEGDAARGVKMNTEEQQIATLREKIVEGKGVPPLEAVVKDVFLRRLARLAHENSPQQKTWDAKILQMRRGVVEEEDEPTETLTGKPTETLTGKPKRKRREKPKFNMMFNFQNPHAERLPFRARTKLRHFDFCGPLPRSLRDARRLERSFVWTTDGGNAIVNHFPMERVARTTLGMGISIVMWRGIYDMQQMEKLTSAQTRLFTDRVQESAEAMARAATQKGGPSKRVRDAAQERIRQLNIKSYIMTRLDGGWMKILTAVARSKGVKAPVRQFNGVLFYDKSPHPDRDTIESVWNKRMAALSQRDAIQNYAGFLRKRMEAGILPETPSRKEAIEAEKKRGWQTPAQKRREHPSEIANRKAAVRELKKGAAAKRAGRVAMSGLTVPDAETSPKPPSRQPAKDENEHSAREKRQAPAARGFGLAQLGQASSETQKPSKRHSLQQQQPVEEKHREKPAEGDQEAPFIVRRTFAPEPQDEVQRERIRRDLQSAAETKRKLALTAKRSRYRENRRTRPAAGVPDRGSAGSRTGV